MWPGSVSVCEVMHRRVGLRPPRFLGADRPSGRPQWLPLGSAHSISHRPPHRTRDGQRKRRETNRSNNSSMLSSEEDSSLQAFGPQQCALRILLMQRRGVDECASASTGGTMRAKDLAMQRRGVDECASASTGGSRLRTSMVCFPPPRAGWCLT